MHLNTSISEGAWFCLRDAQTTGVTGTGLLSTRRWPEGIETMPALDHASNHTSNHASNHG